MTKRVILVQGWVSFRISFGSLLAPFWYHFRVILESILAHFGVPGGDPPREGGRFGDPLLEHFGVTFGTPWGPLGDPLGDPWGPQGAKKGPKGSQKRAPERAPEKDPKMIDFRTPPWRVKTMLSLKREHRFQDFRGVAFGPHFGTILAPFWTPRGPLFSPRGARRGKKGVRKGV